MPLLRLSRVLFLLVVLAAFVAPVQAQPSWQVQPPDRFGFDAAAVDSVVGRAQNLAPLNSLLLARGDTLVVEWYAPGMSARRSVNVKSASKSVLSALTGLAIADGHLSDVDQPIGPFFPDVLAGTTRSDSVKRSITVQDLLTMRAGLESTSFGNYGAWVSSSDWARDALERPLIRTPGTGGTIYSTGTTHLLAVVLAKATETPLRDYAQAKLFDPLGVQIRSWQRDPQGYYFGGNNLALTPTGLLRYGQLFLNGGRWNGRQILPAEWVIDAWTPRVFRSYRGFQYGYLWWIEDFGGRRTYFAWGYGGQLLFVVPSLDLVAVMTSSLTSRPDGVGDHSGRLMRFFGTHVVPAATPDHAERHY